MAGIEGARGKPEEHGGGEHEPGALEQQQMQHGGRGQQHHGRAAWAIRGRPAHGTEHLRCEERTGDQQTGDDEPRIRLRRRTAALLPGRELP